MIDKTTLNETILEDILDKNPENTLTSDTLPVAEVRLETHLLLIMDELLSGNGVLLQNGSNEAIILGIRSFQSRDITESQSEAVVRGPREAFTEVIRTNTSLVRRIIRSPRLKVEGMKLGTLTKTDIAVLYIEGITNQQIVDEVKERLSRIHIDGILESSYIEEFIEDQPFSLFPQVENTEKPDKVASALLNGKVAIFVNGTPIVLMVPAILFSFLQASEDYYERFFYASVIRLIRLLFFHIALLLPSLYIAITTYHQEMLPTELLIAISTAREGVPFPAVVEAIIMETTFEILREAGLRLPRQVGSAVSIVGALVIGQAAIQASIVSPAMVIVVASTGIATFAIPAYNLTYSLRILKYFLMILASIFGLFGVISGVILIVMHVCKLKSFGIPYLSGFAPFIPSDQKDVYIRVPRWFMVKRPLSYKPEDTTRQSRLHKLKQYYVQFQEDE